jgi:hypothetical protein
MALLPMTIYLSEGAIYQDSPRLMRSTFEWRRIAPLHFWAKADNARLAAAALWHLSENDAPVRAIVDVVGYGGSSDIAYEEAFWREAAIAVELIVKAVIAQQMTMRRADPATEGVPATHDLPTLWVQAGLPKLGRRTATGFCVSNPSWCGRGATSRRVRRRRGSRRTTSSRHCSRRGKGGCSESRYRSAGRSSTAFIKSRPNGFSHCANNRSRSDKMR